MLRLRIEHTNRFKMSARYYEVELICGKRVSYGLTMLEPYVE